MKRKNLFNVGNFCLMTILCACFLVPAKGHAQDCQKAEALFNQALGIESEPGDIQALMQKEHLYSKALDLCPDYAQAHNNQGDVYEKLGRYDEAISEYKRVIELRNDVPFPYFGLGDIYFKNGQYEKAIAWYEKGLAFKPDDRVTKEMLAQARLLSEKESHVVSKEEIVQVLGRSQIMTRGPGEKIKMCFNSDKNLGLIPFDTDEYTIREDAKAQLNELGKALCDPKLSQYVFEIGGHTDIRGSEAYNQQLSQKRANAVKIFLMEHFSISDESLQVNGYGESRIIARGTDKAAHAVNRRVEITRLHQMGKKKTSTSKKPPEETQISLDVGLFYKDGRSEQRLKIRDDGSSVLQTGKNPYQIFFRPYQQCYVYLLQKDSTGRWYRLFPKKGSDGKANPVSPDQDYWIPGFDEGFSLDENTGEEKIYFLASLWEVEGLESPPSELQEVVVPITRTFRTRGVSHIGKPKIGSVNNPMPNYENIVGKVMGSECFARIISFVHQ